MGQDNPLLNFVKFSSKRLIQMNFTSTWPKIKLLLSSPITWVLLGGFFVRFYSAAARGIINRDGHHYIYQAQAIFSGEWSNLVSCKISFVSIYPFFIAAANMLFHDWIVSGVFVSLLFGWATLFPLYFLLRRFVSETVCAAAMVIYALVPTFVNCSGDIVRGPVFWFFLSLGMLMFVRQWDEQTGRQRYRLDLLMSCFFFLLAAWARVEGVAFIAASLFYLLIARTERKLERVLIFTGPLISIALAATAIALFSNNNIAHTVRVEEVAGKVTELLFQYKGLHAQIKALYLQHDGLISEFLHRIRESLWIIPFAIILHNIIEVFFYPFALIYFIGLINIRHMLRQHQHASYFLWLMLAGFGVLYLHLIHSGIMIHRFFSILILPSCIVMAHGVETTIAFLQKRYRLQPTTAVIVVVTVFCLIAIPKNMRPKEKDGFLYRQAAQLIEKSKPNDQVELIAGAKKSSTYDYIFLYAHRKYPAPLCGEELIATIAADTDYDQLIARLDRRNIRYLLYEERYWPKHQIDFLAAPYQRDFDLLKEWRFSDRQKIMLFERVKG
jgi:4-amino-4-deoxy-L-arabinose transferase-like glycosyltransferase